MSALDLTAQWPVNSVAAAIVGPDGAIDTIGDPDRPFNLASISKMFAGYCLLIAHEEGTLRLDDPAGQPGCTVRHLLSHAGGYPFDGPEPITGPERRRIYSNTGIELVAQVLADAAAMPYEQYLRQAVFEPLGLAATTLRGSAAHGIRSTVADLLRFIAELRAPQLLSAESAAAFATVQFPGLAGMVPGVARYPDCPWGLATEIRGDKQPHWTGAANSPATFGHFGGTGTLLWVDPEAHVACLALTDRRFDEWADAALRVWPEFSDAALAEAAR